MAVRPAGPDSFREGGGSAVGAGRDADRVPGGAGALFQRTQLLLERLDRSRRIVARVQPLDCRLQRADLLADGGAAALVGAGQLRRRGQAPERNQIGLESRYGALQET